VCDRKYLSLKCNLLVAAALCRGSSKAPDFIFYNNAKFPTTTTNNMSSDDSSELSSVPSEDETDLQLTKTDGILKFFTKTPAPKSPAPKVEASPPRPKRAPSPPHEYVLADNSDIAVSK
jgi:hypothetical protein